MRPDARARPRPAITASIVNGQLHARLDAADALAQAVKLQAAGVPQDPPMFKALVSLLSEREKNEPLHAAAYIALAPIRPYIIGGSGAGQFPPDGGWAKWLDQNTIAQARGAAG